MNEPLNIGSHDLPITDELAAFMRTGWARESRAEVSARPIAPWAAKRRATLAQRFPGERLVIPAGTLKVRSNDSDYRFRPHSAYSYLTGASESDDVLVIEPSGQAVLYVRPRAPRGGRGVLPRPPLRRVLGRSAPRPGRGRGAVPDRVRPHPRSRAGGPGAGAARGGRLGRRGGAAGRG
ncbi:aminopeptidase P N-terminal domain-containing protein [Nonomuraea antimicrobica]